MLLKNLMQIEKYSKELESNYFTNTICGNFSNFFLFFVKITSKNISIQIKVSSIISGDGNAYSNKLKESKDQWDI